jgi:pyruvate-ferredoxin/flavodoxin oxidoreductase
MSNDLRQQDLAVRSGHWPLLRFDPRRTAQGQNPLVLDSQKPSIPYRDFAMTEARFSILSRTHAERSEQLLQQAQRDVNDRYRHYRLQAEQPSGRQNKNEQE